MATPPNRAAGLTSKDFNDAQAEIKLAKLKTNYNQRKDDIQNNSFKISYGTAEKGKVWYFALPPAIESALQYSPNSSLKGSIAVPEVKPGLLNISTMKYKNFIVPGGTPAVQGIGVQSTTFQLVGMIIGTEGVNSKPSVQGLYGKKAVPEATDSLGVNSNNNAATAAVEFDMEMAQKMREVTVEIKADVLYTFTGVILNFKYYMRRSNCTYYIIDFLATNYKKRY